MGPKRGYLTWFKRPFGHRAEGPRRSAHLGPPAQPESLITTFLPLFVEYYPKKLEEKLDLWMPRREALLIRGPRQSGKTTLLLHLK